MSPEDQSFKSIIDIFDAFAEQYWERHKDPKGFKDALDAFCTMIANPSAAILDVACGPGNVAHYLLQKHPDFQVLGIDLAPRMVEVARLHNPQGRFDVMDVREIGKLTERFDGIVCGFCLPYLNMEEARSLMRDMAMLLNPGGALYLSVLSAPNDHNEVVKNSKGDLARMHYYSLRSLELWLASNGISTLSKHAFESDQTHQNGIQESVVIGRKAS